MTATLDPIDPMTIPQDPPAPGRRWAWGGVVAGAGALVSATVISGGLAVDTDLIVDNEQVLAEIEDAAGFVWAYQTVSVLVAGALVLFAAGLHRRLAARTPRGSLVPVVAAAGALLAAATTLVGSGICTEMFHGLLNADEVDPDTVAAQLAVFNTIGWVWAAVGLTAGSVAYAGRRYGAVSNRFATASTVAAALVGLCQVVPFQYMAIMPAAIWALGAGIAFLREDG